MFTYNLKTKVGRSHVSILFLKKVVNVREYCIIVSPTVTPL